MDKVNYPVVNFPKQIFNPWKISFKHQKFPRWFFFIVFPLKIRIKNAKKVFLSLFMFFCLFVKKIKFNYIYRMSEREREKVL